MKMNTCILCKSSKKDDVLYGEFLKNNSFGVHTFCLYLSSGLPQNGSDDNGFLGFLQADIKKEEHRVSCLNCFYCHKPYANIGCCLKKCRRTFHLICGIDNFCENTFCHDFSSYCHQHIHKVKERPSKKETCLICFDSIWTHKYKFIATNMIQTPCCRNGWFHKLCLQKFAKTSGYFFKCPLCNDAKVFREKLPSQGIFIPNQDAAWELEPNAFAELLERPSECAAFQCKNRQGRKVEKADNSFVICSTCGSTAMHKQCLPNEGNSFHCADCTIAIEEADSGHESINSQQNHGNDIGNDDEIDVCNVSDREDLDIIQVRIGKTNNNETEKCKNKERDSGLTSNHEERHRQKSGYKSRRIRSETENSEEKPRGDEKPGHSRNYKTKLYENPIQIINDSSSEEEEEEAKGLSKTSLLHNCDSTSSDEALVIKPGHKRTFNIDSDTDNEQVEPKTKRLDEDILENRPSSSKNCEKSNFIDDDSDDDDDEVNKSKNISIVSIESSDDDNDPLENFTKIMEKQKNIRMSHDNKINNKNNKINFLTNKESSTSQAINMKTITNEDCLKRSQNIKTTRQPENVPAKLADKKSKSRCFKPLKEEINTKASNDLDISCIAKRTRTRRKSMGSCMRSKSIQEKENHKEIAATSSLNTSCIAVRTRRRTVCAQSAKEKFDLSPVYEKLQDTITDESANELEIVTEEDEDTESYYFDAENEESEEEDINDFIVPDAHKEKDSIFEISCIANRTRKRKSLNNRSQTIYEIDDTTCSSSTYTTASSTLTSPSDYFNRTRKRKSLNTCSTLTSSSDSLNNVNLNKRSSKRILSSSVDSISSSSSFESHYTSKSKCLNEKFPQQNDAAFLNTKLVSSKSSSSNVHNYYPNNQYHPHSNNRKRL